MKQIIKSATVYKADFGMDADALHNCLANERFQECTPQQIRSVGFLPPSEGDSMTAAFQGGFAFRVRIDQKVIPAAQIKHEVEEAASNIKRIDGRTPGKKERAEIKEAVMLKLAETTFPRTAMITCFYQQETGYLIIPTTSQKLADIITSKLVATTGSVKTQTLHISNVKHGLTTRLRTWLEQQSGNSAEFDAFGAFDPCSEVALQQEDRKIAIKMGSLDGAHDAIKEALGAHFQVTSIGLTHKGDTEFRLTHDFKLKSIEFSHTDSEDDEESQFYSQSTLEVDAVSAIITDLIDMIGHGEDEAQAGGQEGAAA